MLAFWAKHELKWIKGFFKTNKQTKTKTIHTQEWPVEKRKAFGNLRGDT